MYERIERFKTEIKVFMAHPLFPLVVAFLAALIAFPSIRSGWFMDDIWHRVSYASPSTLDENERALFNMLGPMRAYTFLDGSTERAQLLMDKGLLPWWANPETRINFWRPLSALALQLDYTLFPEQPEFMHVQSILCFVILGILVSFYFRDIFGLNWLAGLAAVLYVVDDAHAIPVTWLANRHAVITAVFGVASIILYHRWYIQKRLGLILISCAFFILALFSSEIGLVAFAYILSYAVFINKDSIPARIKSVLPYIVLILAWRVLYSALGYGASGIETYIDPLHSPFQFAVETLVRLPILMVGILGWPPAEVYLILSPQAIYLYSTIAWALIISFAFFTRQFWMRSRIALFWLGGMICAIIPLCAAMPGSRNLGLACIGAMGFMVELFKNYLSSKSLSRVKKAFGKILFVSLGVLYLLVAPMSFLGTSAMLGALNTNSLTDFGNIPQIAERDVILVNAPGSYVVSFLLPDRVFQAGSLPKHLRILSPGFTPLEIKRLDLYTLVVRPEGGYYMSPGPIEFGNAILSDPASFIYFLRRIERFPQDGTQSVIMNSEIRLTNVTIKNTDVTPDGRPAEAEFRFAYPLEDQMFKWLIWNASESSYQDFTLPQVGEIVKIE